ncbi:MAG: hypothetical protein LBP85_02490 [Prevotellaceae bacterium]|jgi:hypothetical protein|nr:hypothetical protein [Prevotellaceae bacterium]
MTKKYLNLNGLAYFASKLNVNAEWIDISGFIDTITGFGGKLPTASVKMKREGSLILLSITARTFDSSSNVISPGLSITFRNGVYFGNVEGLSCALIVSANKAIYGVVASGNSLAFNKITNGGASDAFNSLIVFPYV